MQERVRYLAILMVDICKSMHLYEVMGDLRASDLISASILQLSETITKHGGRIVNIMGDGILSTFGTNDDSFRAALAMQRDQYGGGIHVSVGLNFGKVVERNHEVFGDSLNVAARLVSLAKPEEIILSGEAAEKLSPKFRRKTRFFDRSSVEGRSARTDIYCVTPDQSDTTKISSKKPTPELRLPGLLLKFERREFVLGAQGNDFTIGRDESCNLVVMGQYVSHIHSTIICRRGKYFLIDHSTNGTFVNGQQLMPFFPEVLTHGDDLQLGKLQIKIGLHRH